MTVRSYQSERAHLEEHTQELARALTLAVDRELKSKVVAVETLATAIPLQTGGLAGFRRQAEIFLEHQPAGSAIVLLDPTGRRLLDTRIRSEAALPDSEDRESLRQVFGTKRTWISDLFVSTLDGEPRVSIDVPVEVNGRPAYDLSMRIPLDSLATLIVDQDLPAGWITSIIDRKGTIVARSLAPERFVGKPVVPELLQAVRKREEGAVAMLAPEGVSMVTVFSRLPMTGWKTAISIPQESVEAPLRRNLLITAAGGTLLLAVAALLAVVMADRIARPILSLRRAALALARGEEPERPLAGIREVNAVGLALRRTGALLRAGAAARDRTEQALRRSEALLHRAQMLARLGHWTWTPDGDAAGGLSDYSPAGAAIFGVAPEALAISNAEYLRRFVHPDDREQVRRSMQDFIASDRTDRVQTYRILRADGQVRTIHEVAEKVLSPDGAVDHTLGTVQDISERKRAEEALRESERRERARAGELAALLKAVPAVVFVAQDPDCATITGSRAAYELLRRPPGSNLSKSTARAETDHFKVFKDGVELLPQALPLQRAARGEELRDFDEQIVFADGTLRHLYGHAIPLRDERGAVQGAVGAFLDITEHKRGEQALREREEQLKVAIEAAALGTWHVDIQTGHGGWSGRLADMLGLPSADTDLLADEWQRVIHPEDRTRVAAEFQACLDGHAPYDTEFRILRTDGAVRWLAVQGKVIRSEGGEPWRAVGVAQDITERKRWEEQQRLLMAELNHRVKNTLAVVQSIAAQTLRHSASPEAFNPAFLGRLRALASAHTLLTRGQWQAARLEVVIWQALRPHLAGDRAFVIDGPDAELSPKQTLGLSLVLHELATNAAKYGALRVRAGRVEVRWILEGNAGRDLLCLDWSEFGGPAVSAPAAEGFGTMLIRQTLAYDLDGKVEIRYEPRGVQCRLLFPLQGAAPQEKAV